VLVIVKDRSVRLYAQQNGVALPEAGGQGTESRTKIADALGEEGPARPSYFNSNMIAL
jgi:hypothetical protein